MKHVYNEDIFFLLSTYDNDKRWFCKASNRSNKVHLFEKDIPTNSFIQEHSTGCLLLRKTIIAYDTIKGSHVGHFTFTFIKRWLRCKSELW